MLLIKNGRVVDPKSGFDQVVDVLVDGKKIIKIADSIEEASAEIIDATGLFTQVLLQLQLVVSLLLL